MSFDYTLDIDKYEFSFTMYVDPCEQRPIKSNIEGKRALSAEFELDIHSDHLPLEIEFIPRSLASISPIKKKIDDVNELGYLHEFIILVPEGDPINFYIEISYADEQNNTIISSEMYAPPYRVFEWGKRILPTRWQDSHTEPAISAQQRYDLIEEKSFDDFLIVIESISNNNGSKQAVEYFIHELSRWLPAWESYYLRALLNERLDNISPVSKGNKVNRFWADQLITEDYFEFSNWNEFSQFVQTTKRLENGPDLNEGDILSEAMAFLIEDEMGRTEPLKHLWKLETTYDLSMVANDNIQSDNNEYINTLLAKAITEEDYFRFQQLLSQLTGSSISHNIDEKIEKAMNSTGSERLRRWRDLLSIDVQNHTDDFYFIVENYFDIYDKQNELQLVTREAISEARIVANDKRGEGNYVRTSRYYYHYYRGLRHLQNNRYDEASEELLLAIGASLEEYSKYNDINYTNLDQSLIKYYRSEKDRLQKDQDFTRSARQLEDALSIVDNFRYFESNPDKQEYVRNRLNIYLHEIEGNRHLSNHELKEAASEFGKAVSILKQLGRESEANYFENRRQTLEAAKKEQMGEFESAANIHDSIGDSFSTEDKFARFHKARAKICHAKQKITQREIQGARNTLKNIEIGWGITRDEVEYLNMILDELENYELGTVSDIGDTLDEFANFSLDTDDDLYVSYGHDYRPLVVYLLAAQRLTQFEDTDPIPELLVEFSLEYILRPDKVEQFIKREGIADLGTDDQWKQAIPTFVLKRYQEAVRTESGKVASDNFDGLGEKMTTTLEQYLLFLVEYYQSIEYGDNWPEAVNCENSDITLRNLVNYIGGSAFDELPWADTVSEILTRKKYENVVVPEKDGDIVDLRNDLDHPNKVQLAKSEYEMIKEDLITIFAKTSVEIPVLGRPKGKNDWGVYTIELFHINTNSTVQITTDMDLDSNSIYYFPPDTIDTSPGDGIDPCNIVQCETQGVLQGIRKYCQ